MSIFFGLIGILFLLAIVAVVVLLAIFMARKVGLIKPSEGSEENGDSNSKSGSSFKSYLNDLKKLSNSLIFRFGVVAILVGVMTIPMDMVNDIVRERSQLYRSVLNEIAGTWGHKQTLTGPALLVPYTEKFVTEKVLTDKDGNERKVDKTIYKKRTAIILPNDLKIDSNLEGQKRKRSLYESLVYTADLQITGNFKHPDIKKLSNHIDKVHWDRAWFALGISDTQAINKVSSLKWLENDKSRKIDFEPGTAIVKILPSGFHAPIQLSPESLQQEQGSKNRVYDFSLNINVNGSQGFYFRPFGKTTDVAIKSDWPHPSFQGNVLPDTHNITENGFDASWSVPHLARNYPQIWTIETQSFNVNEFTAGVNMFESVSLYSQVTRAIKYGILFISLTYITFLIFELGIGRSLHVVQYAMIGLALSMFYLVLLSMAEHAGFFKAYVSAASIIILMISLYAYAAIRKLGRTGLIAMLLAGLYSMLYSLFKLEDYALLAGTGLLLVILGVMMYLTRNVGREKKQEVKQLSNEALLG